MKRLATAIALLLVILAVCYGTQRKLTALSEELSAAVDHFSICAWQNDIQNAKEAVAGAKRNWESNRALLGSILPHTELDEIDRLFAISLQAIENGDLSECRLRAAELTARIQHLPERDLPKIENIL